MRMFPPRERTDRNQAKKREQSAPSFAILLWRSQSGFFRTDETCFHIPHQDFPFLLRYDCRIVRICEKYGIMLTVGHVSSGARCLRCAVRILRYGGRAFPQRRIFHEWQRQDILYSERTIRSRRQPVIIADASHIMDIAGRVGDSPLFKVFAPGLA